MPISEPGLRGLRRRALAFAAAAACAGPVSGMPDVTVVGPPGYCVDEASRQERVTGSFVLLGICAGLGKSGDRAPEQAAVLTALVSPPTDPPQRPTPAQMLRFFGTAPGRAALAHDGDPNSVTLLDNIAVGDVLYLKLRDDSPGRPADLEAVSWRAAFPLVDRLVALSATGHVAHPIADAEARETLRAFVRAMISANAPERPKPRPGDET